METSNYNIVITEGTMDKPFHYKITAKDADKSIDNVI